MKILETFNDYREYKQSRNNRHLRQKFGQELNSLKLMPDQLSQAQGLQRVFYNAFEKMDDMSQSYAEKATMYINFIFLASAVVLGGFLLKQGNHLIKLVKNIRYKNWGDRFTNYLREQPEREQFAKASLGAIPLIFHIPVAFYISREASRIARHKARNDMSISDFAIYNAEQLSMAEKRSGYAGYRLNINV